MGISLVNLGGFPGNELGPVTKPNTVDVTVAYQDLEASTNNLVIVTILTHDFPSEIEVFTEGSALRVRGSSQNLIKSPEGIKYVIGTRNFVQSDGDVTKIPKEGEPYEWKPSTETGAVYSVSIRVTSNGPGVEGPILVNDVYHLTVVNDWSADRDAIVNLANDTY